MIQYQDLLRDVLDNGITKDDRTGTGTLSVFGRQLRFDLAAGFPALTTKLLHWKSIVEELLWFLRGDTNAQHLDAKGVKIWNDWAAADGALGPIYGQQWRSWRGADGLIYDQIKQVIDTLTHHPDSRRMIVSAWNVPELPQMALEPCHVMFQLYSRPWQPTDWDGIPARKRRRLSLQVYQRSADLFLGVPFNIASYALLTHILARLTNHVPETLIWTGGDCHLYSNHREQARTLLQREPRPLPHLLAPYLDHIDTYAFTTTAADYILHGYDPHPAIPAPVAV